MSLSTEPEAKERVPLMRTAAGVVLMEGTRVPLDTVVDGFNAGKSAEEIALSYPTLGLGDLYAVLAYYLHQRAEVDWFNHRRLHGELGMIPPVELEAIYYHQPEPALLALSQLTESL